MRPLRDPAPSRLAYRLNRLMLTPRFRVFLRFGVPVLLFAAVLTVWASDDMRREQFAEAVNDARRQVEERPEFQVRMMVVDGATPEVEAEIRRTIPVDFPVSSFDLDLDIVRGTIERHDPIARAAVQVRGGGVLAVTVEERVPVAVFRSMDGVTLVDGSGHRVMSVSARTDRPELPLILGFGADKNVDEALRIFDAVEPVSERVRGLRRVGERRWDILLDRGQVVMLPEVSPILAVERVIALELAQDLLSRDVTVIDFRNPDRPVLRLSTAAVEAIAPKPARTFGVNPE